jgi:hypothetical protein
MVPQLSGAWQVVIGTQASVPLASVMLPSLVLASIVPAS